jgi:hypothetical protein
MRYVIRFVGLLCGISIASGFASASYSQSQGVIHKETYWQLRSKCQISSPKYNGPCRYTVISLGRSINIHFNLDELGHSGVTFISNSPVEDGDGISAPLVGFWYRIGKPSPASPVEGECAIAAGLLSITCITSDGSYSAVAEGIITR